MADDETVATPVDPDAVDGRLVLRLLWVVVRLIPVVWLMRAGETLLYQGF